MSELHAVIAAARALRDRGEEFLIATVVGVHGSSYRRPGARMLVTADRWIAGCVSGGCLEGDIVKRGWWHTAGAAATVVTYDSSADDQDPGWGIGLGCNGVVDILIERVEPVLASPSLAADTPALSIDALLRIDADANHPVVVVTVFRSSLPEVPVGMRRVFGAGDSTGDEHGRLGSSERWGAREATGATRGGRAAIDAWCLAESSRRLASPPRRSGADAIRLTDLDLDVPGGQIEVLVETIVPAPHLFVCGAGRDAAPVVGLGRLLGWTVTVHDWRRRPPERDGRTRPHHLVAGLGELEQAVRAAGNRAVTVVMSHDYETDRALVGMLLATSVPHIGVLGPRRRTEKILGELSEGGMVMDAATHDRIFAPVGLAIGAETPEEIALAILSEAQAVLAGGTGGFLRDFGGAIHDAARGRASTSTHSPLERFSAAAE